MSSSGIARGRLAEERKAWRRDHPIGFYARPTSSGDGSSNMFIWEAGIPGKDGSDWAGGKYRIV
jgi:ubiquitin-conjugating enzyme E2 I